MGRADILETWLGDKFVGLCQVLPSYNLFFGLRRLCSFLFNTVLLGIDIAHRQLETPQYKPALALIDALLIELMHLDDKMIHTKAPRKSFLSRNRESC